MLPKRFPFFSCMRTGRSARIKMVTIIGDIYEVLKHARKSAYILYIACNNPAMSVWFFLLDRWGNWDSEMRIKICKITQCGNKWQNLSSNPEWYHDPWFFPFLGVPVIYCYITSHLKSQWSKQNNHFYYVYDSVGKDLGRDGSCLLHNDWGLSWGNLKN